MNAEFSFYPQVGTDVGEFARKKDAKYRQPFLLATGPEKKPSRYYLIVDNLSIPATDDIVPAMDRLFKAYYCFNVEFPPTVAQLWEFLSFELYGITTAKMAKPHLRSLATAIRRM